MIIVVSLVTGVLHLFIVGYKLFERVIDNHMVQILTQSRNNNNSNYALDAFYPEWKAAAMNGIFLFVQKKRIFYCFILETQLTSHVERGTSEMDDSVALTFDPGLVAQVGTELAKRMKVYMGPGTSRNVDDYGSGVDLGFGV